MQSYLNHPLRARRPDGLTVAHLCADRADLYDRAGLSDSATLSPTFAAFAHYAGVEIMDRLAARRVPLRTERKLVEAWHESAGVACRAVIHYGAIITLKELRHGKNKGVKAWGPSENWTAAQQAANEIATNSLYLSPHKALGGLAKSAKLPVADLYEAVAVHYYKGGWVGSYGGPKWGAITDVLRLYFDGQASAVLAADRMWTMQHNTCSIFNKGIIFAHHDATLHKLLDRQAEGSVLEMRNEVVKKYSGDPLRGRYMEFEAEARAAGYDLPSGGTVTESKGAAPAPSADTPPHVSIIGASKGDRA